MHTILVLLFNSQPSDRAQGSPTQKEAFPLVFLRLMPALQHQAMSQVLSDRGLTLCACIGLGQRKNRSSFAVWWLSEPLSYSSNDLLASWEA